MATHSSTLAWKIPWAEKPGGLQSMAHKESDVTERPSTGSDTLTFPSSELQASVGKAKGRKRLRAPWRSCLLKLKRRHPESSSVGNAVLGTSSEAAWQAGKGMLWASDPAHLTFFLNILDIYGA